MTILNPRPAPPAHISASRMRVWDLILEDLDTALRRDPAARTRFEAAASYPGAHTLWTHCAASAMWRKDMRIPTRLLQQLAHTMTGIDIHPAACIGHRLFIDHATGVVTGETAMVGKNYLVFHGVTLSGQRMVHGKYHPTVGDYIIIEVGTKVLGAIHVDDDTKIGANAMVVKDVPFGGVAIGVPAKLRKPEYQVDEDVNDMNIGPSLLI